VLRHSFDIGASTFDIASPSSFVFAKAGPENGMSSASPPPNSGDVFDVRRIRRLVELMNEHELSEIDLRQADTRIRIRRGPEQVAQIVEPRGVHVPAAPAANKVPAAEAAKPPADQGPTKDYLFIRSPTVGTFYASPEPGKPPFVKVGDVVSPDTTVCIVEAMKVFNAIPADVSGRIVAMLVENEQPVEYNQPLFKVEPL
jgi:acetyl-CoA carboxylase biotin carboxyl carrier protein